MRVLFVDDELDVLEGLENRLRKLRRSWDMSFLASGAEAMVALDDGPFDLVVTDLRMPGVNGAELLTEVRDRHAETIRIILTSTSNPGAILQRVPAAHQVLTKPCDTTLLQAAVERARTLRSLLEHDGLRAAVAGIMRMPRLPELYQRINAVLSNPNAGLPEVARVVAEDASTTIRLLQVVNSAVFGLSRPMATAAEAVSYLGLDAVKGLVLSSELFDELGDKAMASFSLADFQQHATAIARAAASTVSDDRLRSATMTAAMLHDIGDMVIATSAFGGNDAVEARVAADGVSIDEAEALVRGFTHAEVGGYLLALWGLPDVIVQAVTHHHHPSRATGDAAVLAEAIRTADELAYEAALDNHGESR